MAAAAVPIIASAAGAYFGRQDASAAGNPTQMESGALDQQQGSAKALLNQGQQQSTMGLAGARQSLGYFSKLAQGSRADMAQTLQPETTAMNAAYTGAGKSIQRFLRGPDRSVQLGEMDRERSGKIASLFSSARSNANAQVGQISSGLLSNAASSLSGAGGQFGSVAGQGAYNRITGNEIQRQSGQDWGSLLSELFKTYANKPGSSNSAGSGGRTYNPSAPISAGTPW